MKTEEQFWNDYQRDARTFAIYKDAMYPHVALLEEVGELAGKFAKPLRGDKPLDKQGVKAEIGDVLWNLAVAQSRDFGVCAEWDEVNMVNLEFDGVSDAALVIDINLWLLLGQGFTRPLQILNELARRVGSNLQECARLNIVKLRGRKARGVIQGDGDYR